MKQATFDGPGGIALSPVHPGETLASEIKARGLTANALALKLRVPSNRLSDIMRGKRAISADGAAPRTISPHRGNYELAVAREDFGATVEQEVEAA